MPRPSSTSLLLAVACGAVPRIAGADGTADDDLWRYHASGVALDAGLVAAHPVALETGLATGVGAGITFGERWTWGARASWARATEPAIGWTVTHDDVRAGVTGGAQLSVGRGTLGVRLGLGAAVVHEARLRMRGELAGTQGTRLEDARTAGFPTAQLEAVVALHISGAWLMVLSGGPSLTRIDAAAHVGWMSQVGVAWQL